MAVLVTPGKAISNGPDEPPVRLSLTDDVFLRSDTWARWPLGISLPVD